MDSLWERIAGLLRFCVPPKQSPPSPGYTKADPHQRDPIPPISIPAQPTSPRNVVLLSTGSHSSTGSASFFTDEGPGQREIPRESYENPGGRILSAVPILNPDDDPFGSSTILTSFTKGDPKNYDHDNRDDRDSSNRSLQNTTHSITSSDERGDFVAAATSEGPEKSAMTLVNGSQYEVSYWVAQESKEEVAANVVTSIEESLNAGVSLEAWRRGAGASGTDKERTVHQEETLFLLQDQRVAPSKTPGFKEHETYGTRLEFPPGCTTLRVYAFFFSEADYPWYAFFRKGSWKKYLSEVYSVAPETTEAIKITAANGLINKYLHN